MEPLLHAEQLLGEVLVQIIPIVEDLITLSYQETEALKEDDLLRLSDLTLEQERLAYKLQELEEQRLAKLTALQQALGLEEPPGLGELLDSPQLTQDFLETAQVLWDKFQQLKEQQELNSLILNQSLQYTRKMISIFNYGATYQPDGRVEQVQKSSSLIDKSV